jgi:hypothetical protein
LAARRHLGEKVELDALSSKAGLDVAQAVAEGQLAEGHAAVLLVAFEPLDLAIAAIARHAAAEGMLREMSMTWEKISLPPSMRPSCQSRAGKDRGTMPGRSSR